MKTNTWKPEENQGKSREQVESSLKIIVYSSILFLAGIVGYGLYCGAKQVIEQIMEML
jgi:hypothetical protein